MIARNNGEKGVIIIWEFLVKKECEVQFIQRYNAEGVWVQFFRKGNGFMRTELLRDVENSLRFVTMDYWNSIAEYEFFRREHLHEYNNIDEQSEALTQQENFIGIFEIL
ncbi:MAG: antibiotic biosynthesis monooxygenase [Bacteroidota bacterium]